MTWSQVDYIFPFIVLSYGILMVFVLENKTLDKLATEKMPEFKVTMQSHKSMAWISLFVGGLWSLQNLWFGTH